MPDGISPYQLEDDLLETPNPKVEGLLPIHRACLAPATHLPLEIAQLLRNVPPPEISRTVQDIKDLANRLFGRDGSADYRSQCRAIHAAVDNAIRAIKAPAPN